MSANETTDPGTGPERSGLVLSVLILVAAVANLNLSVANVALPDIGKALDASQTGLNLIAVGYSLGLAASVLYLGAIGDRYGRKMLLLLGTAIAIPASVAAALSGSVEVLFLARVIGGLAAGMAFPTTLSLITVLWSGAPRTKAIALWSAVGGACAALGPLLAGAMLEQFDWGSVFLITVPFAVVALVLAFRVVPAHVDESTEPVDNLSGIMSIVLVAAIVLGLNFAPVPGKAALALGMILVGFALTAAFLMRQRRLEYPLYDVTVASRRLFWVAASAGVIVFGSLMAAIFIGQQFLQNVLAYSTLEAGASILPAAFLMMLVAPHSAKLVETKGSRFTLLLGYGFCLAAFITMLLFWRDGCSFLPIGVAFGFMGIGVGLAGTPASHSLTSSVPSKKAGMASATADLQRDLGGAIMQSILGALLTAGYAAAVNATLAAAPNGSQVTDSVQSQLTKSFGSATTVAEQYPQYSTAIINGAKESFVQGQDWAYLVGAIAVALGGVLVFTMFPKLQEEQRLLDEYASADSELAPAATE
ncbi:MAG: MFS transporter [Thermoleophilaceae bacterium]|nr:MFS transporter [Thermoleophilaceae bacterium]